MLPRVINLFWSFIKDRVYVNKVYYTKDELWERNRGAFAEIDHEIFCRIRAELEFILDIFQTNIGKYNEII